VIAHRSPVSGVDAVGDRLVATAGYDNQVILWNAGNKHPLARVFHDHLVNQCRFSADGRRLVTASSDYTARVWSVPSMRLVSVLSEHDDDVEMAVFDPAGERIATASRDACVRIFENSGDLLHKLEGHGADVISVEWAIGGRQVVSSSDDGTVRRWSAGTGELLETLELDGVEVDTFVCDDAGRLYVGNDDGAIVCVAGGVRRNLRAHDAGIKRIVAGPGRRLVSTSYDRCAKVWQICDDGSLALQRKLEVPDVVWLRSVAFAGPDRLVFSTFGRTYASFDLVRGRWDLDDVGATPGINSVRIFDGEMYTVGDAGVVSRDGRPIADLHTLCNFLGHLGRIVVTGGQAGQLFDATTGDVLHEHWSPLNCSATFAVGGLEHLLVGAYTGEGLLFLPGPAGRPEHHATIKLHDNAVKGLAATGRHVFSVCATGAAAFHAATDLRCLRQVRRGHDRIANGAIALPDGRFASVSRDRKLRLWSLDGHEVVPTPHDRSVKCVTLSRSGRLLATGSYGGEVAVYDWERQEWEGVKWPTASGISSLAPAECSEQFLASSYDGHVYRVGTP
jgi:WD40 repeat protein